MPPPPPDEEELVFYPVGTNKATALVALRLQDIESLSSYTLSSRLLQLWAAYLHDKLPALREHGVHFMPPTSDPYLRTDQDSVFTLFEDIQDDWTFLVIPVQQHSGLDNPSEWSLVVLDKALSIIHLFETNIEPLESNDYRALFMNKTLAAHLMDRFQLQAWNYSLRPPRAEWDGDVAQIMRCYRSGVITCTQMSTIAAVLGAQQAQSISWNSLSWRRTPRKEFTKVNMVLSYLCQIPTQSFKDVKEELHALCHPKAPQYRWRPTWTEILACAAVAISIYLAADGIQILQRRGL